MIATPDKLSDKHNDLKAIREALLVLNWEQMLEDQYKENMRLRNIIEWRGECADEAVSYEDQVEEKEIYRRFWKEQEKKTVELEERIKAYRAALVECREALQNIKDTGSKPYADQYAKNALQRLGEIL